jgi:hypothetical protein
MNMAIDPLTLADNYKLAKLRDDKPAMMAIEVHVRQLAQIHFQRDDVREALRQVETYKALRRPGNGGTKDLKHIADQVERAYAQGDCERLEDGRVRFTLGTLRLTCIDRPGAVAWMAAKYRRGYRR